MASSNLDNKWFSLYFNFISSLNKLFIHLWEQSTTSNTLKGKILDFEYEGAKCKIYKKLKGYNVVSPIWNYICYFKINEKDLCLVDYAITHIIL